jgi:hypothetical protein
MSFGGDVTLQDSAMLIVEMAGTIKESEYDALIVAGALALGGTLDVSFIEGFAPTLGDSFEILTAAGGLTGSFATELLPALSGNLFWNINYGVNSLVLEVAAPGLTGDYNGDGTVDAADYVVWRKGLGTTYTQEHYDLWRASFGAVAADGSSASPLTGEPLITTVPEPHGFVLMLLGSAALLVGQVGAGQRRRRLKFGALGLCLSKQGTNAVHHARTIWNPNL